MALGDDAFGQDGSGIGNEAAPAGNFPLNQIKSADPKGIRCIFEYYLFFPQPIVHEFPGWSFLSNFSLKFSSIHRLIPALQLSKERGKKQNLEHLNSSAGKEAEEKRSHHRMVGAGISRGEIRNEAEGGKKPS